MKSTIERYGALFNLSFTLDASEPTDTLMRKAFGLYNSGIVNALPDDYSEKTDRHVMLTTTKARLLKAFKVEAIDQLLKDSTVPKPKRGNGISQAEFVVRVETLAPHLAAEFLRSFEHTDSVYRSNREEVMSPYKQGEIHDFGTALFVSE